MTSRLNDDTLRITLRGPSESLRDSKVDENALGSSIWIRIYDRRSSADSQAVLETTVCDTSIQ
jgi:hypothetical protein